MFKEARPLNSVAKFHKRTLHPIEEKPVIPSETRIILRIKLLQEELDELKEAVNKKSIKLIADAFCDIQYVLSGAVLEFGLGHYFEELFNEVQRSNMTKICTTKDEALKTIAKYKKKVKGEKFDYKIVNKEYPVFRISDNKVMKSINYLPPKLSEILKKKLP